MQLRMKNNKKKCVFSKLKSFSVILGFSKNSAKQKFANSKLHQTDDVHIEHFSWSSWSNIIAVVHTQFVGKSKRLSFLAVRKRNSKFLYLITLKIFQWNSLAFYAWAQRA